jgi:chromosome segregation ATPase
MDEIDARRPSASTLDTERRAIDIYVHTRCEMIRNGLAFAKSKPLQLREESSKLEVEKRELAQYQECKKLLAEKDLKIHDLEKRMETLREEFDQMKDVIIMQQQELGACKEQVHGQEWAIRQHIQYSSTLSSTIRDQAVQIAQKNSTFAGQNEVVYLRR